jgi:hypothetical protein
LPESGKVNECSRWVETTRLYRLIFFSALDLRVFSSPRTFPFALASTAISALLLQDKHLAPASLALPHSFVNINTSISTSSLRYILTNTIPSGLLLYFASR